MNYCCNLKRESAPLATLPGRACSRPYPKLQSQARVRPPGYARCNSAPSTHVSVAISSESPPPWLQYALLTEEQSYYALLQSQARVRPPGYIVSPPGAIFEEECCNLKRESAPLATAGGSRRFWGAAI